MRRQEIAAQQQNPRGVKIAILKEKLSISCASHFFKLLSQVKGSTVHICDCVHFFNFC
jgi:hypothetical protein